MAGELSPWEATDDGALAIQRAMRRILEGRTTLLITHRLSQIRSADQILLMKNGRLIAHGNHNDLMATSVVYRQIFVPDEISERRKEKVTS